MSMPATPVNPSRAHQLQQIFKWVVYSLLILNWLFYIYEDWTRWTHTATAASTFLDLAGEFATSIDTTAWFILLAMLELETYALDDETLEGWISTLLRAIRLVCFVMLAHTVWAYGNTVVSYHQTRPVENAGSLCELSARDVAHVYNLEYTAVDENNCASIDVDGPLYWLGIDPLVTDRKGLELERQLAWADLIEAVTWLVVIAAIELVVRLQDRNITGGWLMSAARFTKFALYTLLLGFGVYWAWLGHWLYFWDELLWIGGFAVIEMNVSEWRSEILEGQGQLPQNPVSGS